MDFPQFLSPAETSAEKGARNAVIRLVLCVAAMRECNFARGRALKNIPKMFESSSKPNHAGMILSINAVKGHTK